MDGRTEQRIRTLLAELACGTTDHEHADPELRALLALPEPDAGEVA